jgi:hypothetical protein
MRRAAATFGGAILIVVATIWLLGAALLAIFAAAFGADSTATGVGLLFALALGAAALAGGVALAAAPRAAGWSLIVLAVLWVTVWAAQLPDLGSDDRASQWVLVIGDVLLGLATVAAGLRLRGRGRRAAQPAASAT